MKYLRFLKILIALILIPHAGISQQKFSDNLKASANFQYGYSLPEYSFISYFTDEYISSAEINLIKETSGNSMWENLYKYPEVGLSFYYSNLGNDSLFGRAYALNYFFKLNLIKRNKFTFFNRTGIGVAYLTKRFDLSSNRSNVAIGSRLNVHFTLKWGINYSLSDKWILNSGISLDHFSNGNSRDPNRGLNNLTGYAGVSYYIGKRTEKKYPKLDSLVKKNYCEIFANIGGKQPRSLTTGFFLTSSLSASVTRSVFRAVHFGAGIDLFYDSSVPGVLDRKGEQSRSSDVFQTGLFVSQQFIYNRFRLGIVEGIYLGLTNKVYNKLIYTKAFAQYIINDRFSMRITMKSHLHILDYPELGIGIKI
ncbi:MAG: hypothetical protein ACI8Q1_000372 [Parvicella sp.]